MGNKSILVFLSLYNPNHNALTVDIADTQVERSEEKNAARVWRHCARSETILSR
jgi:hypothetical protein